MPHSLFRLVFLLIFLNLGSLALAGWWHIDSSAPAADALVLRQARDAKDKIQKQWPDKQRAATGTAASTQPQGEPSFSVTLSWWEWSALTHESEAMQAQFDIATINQRRTARLGLLVTGLNVGVALAALTLWRREPRSPA